MDVFPAPAGMSPLIGEQRGVEVSFPRTSGDEPLIVELKGAFARFSPHQRG